MEKITSSIIHFIIIHKKLYTDLNYLQFTFISSSKYTLWKLIFVHRKKKSSIGKFIFEYAYINDQTNKTSLKILTKLNSLRGKQVVGPFNN